MPKPKPSFGFISHAGDEVTPDAETFIGERVTIRADGCWIWDNAPDDYGVTCVGGRTIRVHRFVYETLIGPIQPGRHIHHTCEVKGCCNPDHLWQEKPGDHSRIHAEQRRAG